MNRIAAQRALTVDPGSYLLLVHAAGYEDQRIPIRVERGAAAAPAVTLQPSGTTPPGFIPVPAGRFVSAGDPGAFRPREARVLDVPSFSIARFELTNRDWYEFVNDARTLQRIAESSPDSQLYLPQDDRVMAKRTDDGTFTWDVYVGTTADSPVLGLSWTDVRDYLAWRNELADTRREPWRYDLPSAAEWEKAARGVDERLFPWGDRFDPSLSVCLVRQDVYLLDAPGGYELRDESPYGVRDLAGSREEWLRDRVGEVEPPRYLKRGGHWSTAVEAVFHSASDGEASQDRHASTQGVRLVARRP